MNIRLLALSTLALPTLALVAHTPAFADAIEHPHATVSYSDLDLCTERGASRLRARVDQEVIDLSGGTDAASRADVVAARARARAQANAAILRARA